MSRLETGAAFHTNFKTLSQRRLQIRHVFAFGLLIFYSFFCFVGAIAGLAIRGWQPSRKFAFQTFIVISLCLPSLLILGLITIDFFTSPKTVSIEDIIGHYEIDRSKYPGAQADWQNANYSFEITSDDLIITDRHLDQQTKYPLQLTTSGPRFLISGNDRHHTMANGVSLYRRPFSFYYVFHSKNYGDIFLKRID